MTSASHPFGLLVAAHGGRHLDRHSNGKIIQLAQNASARLGGVPVGVGYINGAPPIDAAIAALGMAHVIVYPLFMADGHFLRIAVNSLRTAAEAGRPRRVVTVLPPLGAEPTLANLIAAKAEAAACAQGLSPAQTTLILVAHGSKRGNASRRATEMVADRLRDLTPFAAVTGAYLDGWRRVAHAPALVLGLVVAGVFAFAPAPGLGRPTAELLPRQLDAVWLVVHEALGLGIGPAGPVPLLDGVADPAAVAAALLYLVWSTLLWGGVLDRLARRRRVGTGPFWSACGVYGVRAYSVARRSREIGIRMALGSSVADTLRMILREGMVVAFFGSVLGVLLAAGMAHLVAGFLYEVSARDPWVFGLSFGLLFAVSLVACLGPARRAARLDPLVALRAE